MTFWWWHQEQNEPISACHDDDVTDGSATQQHASSCMPNGMHVWSPMLCLTPNVFTSPSNADKFLPFPASFRLWYSLETQAGVNKRHSAKRANMTVRGPCSDRRRQAASGYTHSAPSPTTTTWQLTSGWTWLDCCVDVKLTRHSKPCQHRIKQPLIFNFTSREKHPFKLLVSHARLPDKLNILHHDPYLLLVCQFYFESQLLHFPLDCLMLAVGKVSRRTYICSSSLAIYLRAGLYVFLMGKRAGNVLGVHVWNSGFGRTSFSSQVSGWITSRGVLFTRRLVHFKHALWFSHTSPERDHVCKTITSLVHEVTNVSRI